MIRVFFQPGTDADSDVTQLSNLALADLKAPAARDPAARSAEIGCFEPACLPGRRERGEGLTEAELHDNAQIPIRNQIAVVKGAEISASVWRKIPADYGLCRSL